MGRVINIDILGHPLNIINILILAAIFWIGFKVISGRFNTSNAEG
jgi:hypothetical protein